MHVTAADNAASIARDGLWPAAELARRAGVDPGTLLLRRTRLEIRGARLNHQLPLVRYLRAAKAWLEVSPEAWAAQLDERVFFWPEGESTAFTASIARHVQVHLLWIDTAALISVAGDRLDVSALNSGSFRQIPVARPAENPHRYTRGPWLYRPLAEGLQAFRTYRRDRGLTASLDCVREVSLRGGLDAETLRLVTSHA
ncbi:MAG: hypothetical protein AAGM84_03020 [Pseudomonadota bacterium]